MSLGHSANAFGDSLLSHLGYLSETTYLELNGCLETPSHIATSIPVLIACHSLAKIKFGRADDAFPLMFEALSRLPHLQVLSTAHWWVSARTGHATTQNYIVSSAWTVSVISGEGLGGIIESKSSACYQSCLVVRTSLMAWSSRSGDLSPSFTTIWRFFSLHFGAKI